MPYSPNPRLKEYLRTQQTDRVFASLRDISDYYAAGSVPPSWESDQAIPLWLNPQAIDYGFTSVWGKTNPHLSTDAIFQWGYRQRDPITIKDIEVWSEDPSQDIHKYLDRIESLSKPGGESSYPPIIAMVWGARVLQPVILTGIQIRERSWASGLASRASIDLTFEFAKSPVYRSLADQARVKALTDREVARVTEDAKERVELTKDAEERNRQTPTKPDGKAKPTQPVITNIANPDQGHPIKVNEKGEVYQGKTKIAVYSKRDANGRFIRDSYTPVPPKEIPKTPVPKKP